jgi:hypothetical protein
VIRIRYEDFSAGTHDGAGVHGRVERCAGGVAVCLLPGLTAWQRRAVIRRLRQEASRGFGPALPLPQLVIALGLDRMRTAAGIVRAIVRLHPAVALVPSATVVAMATMFVIAAGDRPAGAGGGLADAAAVSGSPAGAVGVSPTPARVARVAAGQGSGGTNLGGTGVSDSGTGAGGTGLGSAQRASARSTDEGQARKVRSAGEQPGRSRGKQRGHVKGKAPRTAHRPGPLDFA